MNLTFQCSKDATLTFCLGDGAAADVMTTMLECVKIRIIKANIVKCLETSKCGFCVELWLRMVNQVKSLQTEKLISKRRESGFHLSATVESCGAAAGDSEISCQKK